MAQLVTIVFLAACLTVVVSRDIREEFDDLENFDDLETLDNLETQGNLETRGNLKTSDNLDTIDKRMHPEIVRQLKNAIEFIDAKVEGLKGKLFVGFKGEKGDVSYEISRIKITNLGLDKPEIHSVNDRSAKFTLYLPRFTVALDWWIRYKTDFSLLRIKLPFSATAKGTATAAANRISVTVTVSLSPLDVQSCRASVDLSLDVNGSDLKTQFALFVVSMDRAVNILEDKLEDKLEDVICDAINKL